MGRGDTQKFKRDTALFEEPAFLDDVGDRFHLHAFRFVCVFEGMVFSCLFVLYYSVLGREALDSEAGQEIEVTYLAKGALSNTTEENEMEEAYFSVTVYGLGITGCLIFGDGQRTATHVSSSS